MTQEKNGKSKKIPLTSKEIELAIFKLPTEKNPVPHGFTHEFFQVFKEESANSSQTLPKKKKKREEKETLSNSSMWPDSKAKTL